MEIVEVEGKPHVALTLQEALDRVAVLWKRHPDKSLDELFDQGVAEMRAEMAGTATPIPPAPLPPKTSGRRLASPYVPPKK